MVLKQQKKLEKATQAVKGTTAAARAAEAAAAASALANKKRKGGNIYVQNDTELQLISQSIVPAAPLVARAVSPFPDRASISVLMLRAAERIAVNSEAQDHGRSVTRGSVVLRRGSSSGETTMERQDVLVSGGRIATEEDAIQREKEGSEDDVERVLSTLSLEQAEALLWAKHQLGVETLTGARAWMGLMVAGGVLKYSSRKDKWYPWYASAPRACPQS